MNTDAEMTRRRQVWNTYFGDDTMKFIVVGVVHTQERKGPCDSVVDENGELISTALILEQLIAEHWGLA